jgi:hypothetical protein
VLNRQGSEFLPDFAEQRFAFLAGRFLGRRPADGFLQKVNQEKDGSQLDYAGCDKAAGADGVSVRVISEAMRLTMAALERSKTKLYFVFFSRL